MTAEAEDEPVRVLAEGDGAELLAYLVTAARTQTLPEAVLDHPV